MNRNENMVAAGFENTLHYASATQNIAKIKEYLTNIKPTALNKKYSYFGTPLHIAIEDGNMEIVKLLVEAGADIEVKNVIQETAFLWALDKKQEEIALYLLACGANVHALGCKKENALFIAANKCSAKMVQLLIDKGNDVNHLASAKMNALEWTTDNDNVAAAKVLIENGINKDTITPGFWWACRRNSYKLAEYLLTCGADVNTVYKDKCELLLYICFDQYALVIQLLLDNGIDFTQKLKYNKNFIKLDGSILDRAIELKQQKIVDLITAKTT